MPKKYLVGVGTVRAFEGNNLIFVGKTLIESSMEISVSSTDIRGGLSNALLGQYFHDSALSLTITDAQFNLPMIAKNVGTSVSVGGDIFKTESITLNGKNGTVTGTPVAVDGAKAYVYTEYDGEPYSLAVTGKTFSIDGTPIPEGASLCVAYLYHNINTSSIIIPSNIVPSRLHIYVTVNLTGDVVNGKGFIGTETIEIPIFQLSGSQTISMSADGVSNTNLSGNAIAFFEGGETCEGGGHYAKITEEIYNTNWYDGVTALAISGGDFSMAKSDSPVTLRVYAVAGGNSFLVDNSQLTFTSSKAATATVGANTGIVTPVAAGTTIITAKITNKQDIEASCDVTVAGE